MCILGLLFSKKLVILHVCRKFNFSADHICVQDNNINIARDVYSWIIVFQKIVMEQSCYSFIALTFKHKQPFEANNLFLYEMH